MPFTHESEDCEQEPGALEMILQFVQDDVESVSQIRGLTLRYHLGELGGGRAAEAMVRIVGQDGTHCDLSHDADATLRIVRCILQSHATPQSALEDIIALLNIEQDWREARQAEIFETLESLKDGWLDGQGKAPTAKAVAAARTLIKGINLRHYMVFPRICGGVQFETHEPGEVEFQIEADGKIVTEVV